MSLTIFWIYSNLFLTWMRALSMLASRSMSALLTIEFVSTISIKESDSLFMIMKFLINRL